MRFPLRLKLSSVLETELKLSFDGGCTFPKDELVPLVKDYERFSSLGQDQAMQQYEGGERRRIHDSNPALEMQARLERHRGLVG